MRDVLDAVFPFNVLCCFYLMTISDFIDDIFDSVSFSLFRVVCCAFSELPSFDFRVRISKFFFSDSPREACRDFPLSYLCHQPIQASWPIKATKLHRRSKSEASRAIQAACHRERHRLDRDTLRGPRRVAAC
jgi:hypothetical protein